MKSPDKNNGFLIGALFLLSPITAILGTALNSSKDRSYNSIKGLMVLLILYLSALNTTKVPFSDMIVYLNMFNDVPKNGFLGTLGFWSSGGFKDPFYSLLVYVSYYITFGNQYLFIFFVTFLEYWFMFMALYKFGKSYKLPSHIMVTQVLVLAFFTQYFSLTFHLTRQILAASVFFYALTFRKESIIKYLLGCGAAVAIHSSVGIMIIFTLFPQFQRRLKIREIALLAVFAIFSIVILSTFATFVLKSVELAGSVEGTFSRMANMEGETDTTSGLNQLLGIVFSIIFILLFFFERNNNEKMCYPIVVNLGLVIALLILSLAASPLIQYRFFFFLYSILPFLFPLIMRKNLSWSKVICVIMSLFIVVRFFLTYDHFFEYAPVDEALLYPYFLLIKLF